MFKYAVVENNVSHCSFSFTSSSLCVRLCVQGFVCLLHCSTYREDTWHVLPWDTQRLQHESTKNKTGTSSAKTNTKSLGMWRRIDVFREDSNVFPWGNRSVSPKYTAVSPQDTCVFPQDINVSSHKTSTCLPTRHRSQLWRFCPKTLVSSLKTLVSPLKTLASHFWYRPLKTPKRLGGRHLCPWVYIYICICIKSITNELIWLE